MSFINVEILIKIDQAPSGEFGNWLKSFRENSKRSLD